MYVLSYRNVNYNMVSLNTDITNLEFESLSSITKKVFNLLFTRYYTGNPSKTARQTILSNFASEQARSSVEKSRNAETGMKSLLSQFRKSSVHQPLQP